MSSLVSSDTLVTSDVRTLCRSLAWGITPIQCTFHHISQPRKTPTWTQTHVKSSVIVHIRLLVAWDTLQCGEWFVWSLDRIFIISIQKGLVAMDWIQSRQLCILVPTPFKVMSQGHPHISHTPKVPCSSIFKYSIRLRWRIILVYLVFPSIADSIVGAFAMARCPKSVDICILYHPSSIINKCFIEMYGPVLLKCWVALSECWQRRTMFPFWNIIFVVFTHVLLKLLQLAVGKVLHSMAVMNLVICNMSKSLSVS